MQCSCIVGEVTTKNSCNQIFDGLNEAYEPTRRHILLLLPLIEGVFNMVTQDERQKLIKPRSRPENVVFRNYEYVAPSYNGQSEN